MLYYGNEKEKVEIIREVCYARCDECKTKINIGDRYYRVQTSHNDWRK